MSRRPATLIALQQSHASPSPQPSAEHLLHAVPPVSASTLRAACRVPRYYSSTLLLSGVSEVCPCTVGAPLQGNVCVRERICVRCWITPFTILLHPAQYPRASRGPRTQERSARAACRMPRRAGCEDRAPKTVRAFPPSNRAKIQSALFTHYGTQGLSARAVAQHSRQNWAIHTHTILSRLEPAQLYEYCIHTVLSTSRHQTESCIICFVIFEAWCLHTLNSGSIPSLARLRYSTAGRRDSYLI